MKYLEDAEGEEVITYDITDFIVNAEPAARHLIDLPVEESTKQLAICYDQPVHQRKEREQLLPLERRRISDPKKWKKTNTISTRLCLTVEVPPPILCCCRTPLRNYAELKIVHLTVTNLVSITSPTPALHMLRLEN